METARKGSLPGADTRAAVSVPAWLTASSPPAASSSDFAVDPFQADAIGESGDRRAPASRCARAWLRPGRRVQLDAGCDIRRRAARLLEQRDIVIHLAEVTPRLPAACDVPGDDLHCRQADVPFLRSTWPEDGSETLGRRF